MRGVDLVQTAGALIPAENAIPLFEQQARGGKADAAASPGDDDGLHA